MLIVYIKGIGFLIKRIYVEFLKEYILNIIFKRVVYYVNMKYVRKVFVEILFF